MNFHEARLTEIIQETSDSYSYRMEIPEGYTWRAGQHAVFGLAGYTPAEGERANRVFTIASAPEDGFLMFTTRIAEQHTGFKEFLLHEIKAGDVVLIADAMGSFDIPTDRFGRTLILAGGIGITPVRSLLRHYGEAGLAGHPVTLLYSDNRAEYCYGAFWEEMKGKMPALSVRFITSIEDFNAAADAYAAEYGDSSAYLIAGSPGMNNAFLERFRAQGIPEANLATDVFMGY